MVGVLPNSLTPKPLNFELSSKIFFPFHITWQTFIQQPESLKIDVISSRMMATASFSLKIRSPSYIAPLFKSFKPFTILVIACYLFSFPNYNTYAFKLRTLCSPSFYIWYKPSVWHLIGDQCIFVKGNHKGRHSERILINLFKKLENYNVTNRL